VAAAPDPTVVMGHLHLDHAGGLEHFRGKDIPIYAHELEIKEHYYAVATEEDPHGYVPGDLNWQLNWQPIAHGKSSSWCPASRCGTCPGTPLA
jgi:metal-dependent hydrolase (beta-lactamase superfamily II)